MRISENESLRKRHEHQKQLQQQQQNIMLLKIHFRLNFVIDRLLHIYRIVCEVAHAKHFSTRFFFFFCSAACCYNEELHLEPVVPVFVRDVSVVYLFVEIIHSRVSI